MEGVEFLYFTYMRRYVFRCNLLPVDSLGISMAIEEGDYRYQARGFSGFSLLSMLLSLKVFKKVSFNFYLNTIGITLQI